ncbi:hypothetical protein KKA23_03590 [Patescibacteria group bacterium]|nr:hypothetical protein [Patescibacteria group bacterium]MBU3923029.1 hypothetical protein [Patescibacteria group bacterium]
MTKLEFKRKKKGGKANWGAGWDHFLKDFYDDLDQITKDNYFHRHNTKLINKTFNSMFEILNLKAIPRMKEFKNKANNKVGKKSCQDWLNRINLLNDFFKRTKRLSEKVIAIDSLVQLLRETKDSQEPKKEIKGIVASKGIVQGRAKVILESKDFYKMNKGDILIIDETDATALPLVLKAKAIVTDTGGQLCHAAIVSRELKIPCVVGTKVATRVLRDGDIVRVDANKGIVKIIEIAK